MPIMLKGIEGIQAHAGFALGKSQWICLTDQMSTAFRLAIDEQDTGAAPTPGQYVRRNAHAAHGFHALSLLASLLEDVFILEDVAVAHKYTLQEVSFLGSVPINSNVRLSVRLEAVEHNHEAIALVLDCSMECDAHRSPVLLAKLRLQCESMRTRALMLASANNVPHSHLGT